jgi:SAM-dependent methyltransferase
MTDKEKQLLLNTYASLFAKLTDEHRTGYILEIGCGPDPETLLTHRMLRKARSRVGINLKAYTQYDFDVVCGNSNDMQGDFLDSSFDVVISNMVLEHDQFFWKSLKEIHRILKPGGAFIIGVPGIARQVWHCKHVPPGVMRRIKASHVRDATQTWRVHAAPGDYWRFTEQAYKDVIMDGFNTVTYSLSFMPPLIIGMGIKN